MGLIRYPVAEDVPLDDRLLAHVQAVTAHRFRAEQPFLLSVPGPLLGPHPLGGDAGPAPSIPGRLSLWMHPAIAVQFIYSGSRHPELNPVVLELFTALCDTAQGLVLVPEHQAAARLAEFHERRHQLASIEDERLPGHPGRPASSP